MFRPDQPASRVVEIRRSETGPERDLSAHGGPKTPLPVVLAKLRSEMDGLAKRLAREHGAGSQATLRAEQISHAVQRLEWALDRDGEPPPAG